MWTRVCLEHVGMVIGIFFGHTLWDDMDLEHHHKRSQQAHFGWVCPMACRITMRLRIGDGKKVEKYETHSQAQYQILPPWVEIGIHLIQFFFGGSQWNIIWQCPLSGVCCWPFYDHLILVDCCSGAPSVHSQIPELISTWWWSTPLVFFFPLKPNLNRDWHQVHDSFYLDST